MTSVNTYDFRNDMAKYIALAQSGTKIILKKFNKPVAVLSKYSEDKDDITRFFGFLPDDGESGVEFVNKVRRSKLEKQWVKRYEHSR